MSKIKSFSVGNGDMFYIKHDSDNFTIVDCCLSDDNQERIVKEIKKECQGKEIMRFISTHPDDDHFYGIKYLDDQIPIVNFYCVKNNAIKENLSDHFTHYTKLRDSQKVFHLEKGCKRRWMNESTPERGCAGINICWPDVTNQHYKDALAEAEQGGSPNNISPIFTYTLNEGVTVCWMGDLETDFLENIKDEVYWPKVDILFAPHHGRHSGKVPVDVLEKMKPKIIIVGEAPSGYLYYYQNYNHITQNSAGDITFECIGNKVHISVGTPGYEADFLTKEKNINTTDYYIGTLTV